MFRPIVKEIDIGKEEEEFYLQVISSCFVKNREMLVTVSKRKDNTLEEMLYVYVHRLSCENVDTACVGRLEVKRKREVGFDLEIYCMDADHDSKYLIIKTRVQQECHLEVLKLFIGSDKVKIVNVGMGGCQNFSLNEFYVKEEKKLNKGGKDYFVVLRNEVENGFEILFGELKLFVKDEIKDSKERYVDEGEGNSCLKVFEEGEVCIVFMNIRFVTMVEDSLWVENNENEYINNCLSTLCNFTICTLNMIQNYLHLRNMRVVGVRNGVDRLGEEVEEDSMMGLKCFRKYIKVEKIGNVNWGFIFAQVYQFQNNIPEIHILHRKTLDIIYLCEPSEESRPIFYFNSLNCSFQIHKRMIEVRSMNEEILLKHKFESIWGEEICVKIDDDVLVLCSLDMVYLIFVDESNVEEMKGKDGMKEKEDFEERNFMVM